MVHWVLDISLRFRNNPKNLGFISSSSATYSGSIASISGSWITACSPSSNSTHHKPTIVSVSEDSRIRHNGKARGRVYRIANEVTTDDVSEHPRSSMRKGWEWVTNREFKLEFLYEISCSPDDILSEKEIKELKMRKKDN